MKSVKEIIGTPSNAIRFMLEGIEKFKNVDNFVIDFEHFGIVLGGVCYGCAAAVAAQAAFGVEYGYDINDYKSRANICGVASEDLCRFETAIDHFRLGLISRLESLFGVKFPEAAKVAALMVRFEGDISSIPPAVYRKSINACNEVIALLDDAGM